MQILFLSGTTLAQSCEATISLITRDSCQLSYWLVMKNFFFLSFFV